jgi:hypothetical protein
MFVCLVIVVAGCGYEIIQSRIIIDQTKTALIAIDKDQADRITFVENERLKNCNYTKSLANAFQGWMVVIAAERLPIAHDTDNKVLNARIEASRKLDEELVALNAVGEKECAK